MKCTSLFGIKAASKYGASLFGYIYSEDDLSGFTLESVQSLLTGFLVGSANEPYLDWVSIFTEKNSRMLFELLLSEPSFIYRVSREELEILINGR